MAESPDNVKTGSTRRPINKGPISTITRGLDLADDGKLFAHRYHCIHSSLVW